MSLTTACVVALYIFLVHSQYFYLGECKTFKQLDDEDILYLKRRDMEQDERSLGVKTVDGDGKYVGGFNPECSETSFITPTRKMVKIETEQEILDTPKTRCHWNIIGTETCIPVLSCKKFKLAPSPPGESEPCQVEFFEVTDGSGGYERFCGSEAPQNLTTSRRLRDLYITFQAGPKTKNIPSRGFKCNVHCSEGRDGRPLKETFAPDKDNTCNCGRKPNSDRIVGGENAVKNEFPWIAGLVASKTRKPYCGGTLISDRIVVTAAHCFKGPYVKKENFQILMNGHFMDLTSAAVAKGDGKSLATDHEEVLKQDAKENSIRYDVEKYFIHPLYVRQTNDYDIALIKLKEPVNFKKHNYIKPACIPNLATYNTTYEGVTAIVAGWGLSSSNATVTMGTLQKLSVKVFDTPSCKNFFDERITRRMMCAGFKEGGKDSCKGDSGGPLISEKKRQMWGLIGLVSWGEGCAAGNSPGVYLRISEVNQWIRYISNMEDAVWCSE